jgi:hypothetical protein
MARTFANAASNVFGSVQSKYTPSGPGWRDAMRARFVPIRAAIRFPVFPEPPVTKIRSIKTSIRLFRFPVPLVNKTNSKIELQSFLSIGQRLSHTSNEEQIRLTVRSAEVSGDCFPFAHAQKYEGAVKRSR